MSDREPIVNIFGISGPSGNPVQSPATLYARDDGRWNTFLRQYAVWPTTSNASGSYTIYRIFDAPYTGTYYIRSSADNTGEVFINDLRVGGTTQTVEHHYWWWWGGWWGGYGWGYWNGYNGWWGYWGHRTTDWSTIPTATAVTLAKGINQLRFEVSNQHDVCGFGMTIADQNGTVVWDTRSQAVVSDYTQTCGRYTLTSPIAADVVAYLWGGGGGGGGNDAGSRGGDGAPGQFHKVNFSVDVGDVIEVVVGDGGTAGGSSAGSAGGGTGGASRVNLAGFGSFSGANGAAAGPRGSSGGGGGGGGASLVLVNGIPVGIAGGGGGGGGAGNDGNSTALIAIRNATTAYPDSAQIYSGATTVELSGATEPLNGQRGQGITGDGGGGGGGGGGWQGGSGGTVRGGDSSSYGGQTGGNYPFNQLFKHTAGNVSFTVPAGVSTIKLVSAVAGGAGGGSGNLTQGAGGGGEGARAKDLTFPVVAGRLYEISVGTGGQGGSTGTGLYSGQGTLGEANLTFINAQAGGITSIRDTVTNTYLLKLGGGLPGNLIAGGDGGTVITNTSYNIGNKIVDFENPSSVTLSTYASIGNYSSYGTLTAPPYIDTLGSSVGVFGWGAIPSGAATRTVTTNSRIDLTSSSVLTYYVNRGTEADWGQTPDKGETLNLEYSVNGSSWTVINTVPVNIVRNTWVIRSTATPAECRVAGGVYLRFRQTTSGGSSTKRDTWAFSSVFNGTTENFGSLSDGEDGLATNGAVGGSGGGPAAGRSSGADAITKSNQGSDFGCGSAGAGSKKATVYAANPSDQTRPQTLSGTYGGAGANGSILIRWDEDQRLGEDGDLKTVSNTGWGSFLNTYGMWVKNNESVATVTRTIDAAYSGTYKIRAVATGTMTVLIDDIQVAATTNNSGLEPTPINITLAKGVHQIKFNLNTPDAAKGFAVALSDSKDKLYWDTRDNVFTNPPGQNMRYYVAPYARGGAATQGGANGAVALEIYPAGLCNVKVGGQWRNVTEGAVKVSGVWRSIQNIYVKVNGQWRVVDSAGDLTSLIFTPQYDNYAVSDRAGIPAGPGGGGGGGGCKIICTKLHELGYLPDHIYAADELFGEYLREHDPAAYYGYVRWASVVVDWMEQDGPQCMFWIRDKEKRGQAQRDLAISWARRIATPWAQHMAYKMGVEKEDSRAGRAIMKTGLFISRLIGKFSKADKPTKSVFTGYAMWAAFGLFYVLAGLKDKK